MTVLAKPEVLQRLRTDLAKDDNQWTDQDFLGLLDQYGDRFILEILRIGVAVVLSKGR